MFSMFLIWWISFVFQKQNDKIRGPKTPDKTLFWNWSVRWALGLKGHPSPLCRSQKEGAILPLNFQFSYHSLKCWNMNADIYKEGLVKYRRAHSLLTPSQWPLLSLHQPVCMDQTLLVQTLGVATTKGYIPVLGGRYKQGWSVKGFSPG